MRVDLAGGVEATSRVVEVHLVVGIEAAVLPPPQRREAAVRIEFGKARRKGELGIDGPEILGAPERMIACV